MHLLHFDIACLAEISEDIIIVVDQNFVFLRYLKISLYIVPLTF